jgi:hypothetical protein
LNYSPNNHYWIVAGSPTQVYSSAGVGYVPVSDATYQSWLASGNTPTKIATEADLWDVLADADVPLPSGATSSDVQKDTEFSNIPTVLQKWAFAVDNRVRVLEGQPTRTAAQFRNYVKSLL